MHVKRRFGYKSRQFSIENPECDCVWDFCRLSDAINQNRLGFVDWKVTNETENRLSFSWSRRYTCGPGTRPLFVIKRKIFYSAKRKCIVASEFVYFHILFFTPFSKERTRCFRKKQWVGRDNYTCYSRNFQTFFATCLPYYIRVYNICIIITIE